MGMVLSLSLCPAPMLHKENDMSGDLFGTKLKYTIYYVGALSRLDYLLSREVMSQYLVQTTLVANHTISFRLL